jgi:hypothetical protein
MICAGHRRVGFVLTYGRAEGLAVADPFRLQQLVESHRLKVWVVQ